jgi:hypothetical protein
MKKYKNHYPLVLDIVFYLADENGDEVKNQDGTIKEFRVKDSVRFKHLEYLCEDLDVNQLEEINKKEVA